MTGHRGGPGTPGTGRSIVRRMATEANDPRHDAETPAAAEQPARPAADTGDAEERPVPMSLIDRIGRERAHELMAAAVREAVARQHAAGLPTAHGDGDGRVYLLYPDGTRTYLDDVAEE